MTDNAAAGSDGVGIWYIFGRQVLDIIIVIIIS